MIIAALGLPAIQQECALRVFPDLVSWEWADSLEALCNNKDAGAYFDFDFAPEPSRVAMLAQLLPKPVFVNAVVDTLHEIGQPFIRINAWPGFLKRPLAELSVVDETQKQLAAGIFQNLNWPFVWVPDIPGMISATIIAQIINEAYYTLQDRTSTREEIDVAMRLGTNYPFGPFEWADEIGLQHIGRLLSRLEKEGNRYRLAGALEEAIYHQTSIGG